MISTTTWNEGYVSDVSYTTGFYYPQCPDFLCFCALLYGVEHPDINKEFNYCELGSGNGYTANIIASLYPHANIYAVDFNPAHIKFSTEMKDRAGLKNVCFLEMSFQEMVEEKLDVFPDFDFITLHGVFSWVSEENRNYIVKFAQKKLKPGGILYASYNNMCGWFFRVPLQKFIFDYCKLFPDVISVVKAKRAFNLINKIKEAGANYFSIPAIEKTLNKTQEGSLNYLVHEYLNQEWKPLFFSDVIEKMEKAKLNYIGMADTIWPFEDLLFNDNQLTLLNSLRSSFLKEMTKDYILSLAFRKDIYIKGFSLLPRDIQIKKMLDIKICLKNNIENKKYKIKLPYVQRNVNLEPNLVDNLITEVYDMPRTLRDIKNSNFFKNVSLEELIRVVSILVNINLLDIILCEEERNVLENALSLNKIIAEHSRYNNSMKFLVFPISKTAIHATLFERLVFDAMVNAKKENLEEIIEYVFSFLQNRVYPEKSEEEKREFITKEVLKCFEQKVPFWEKTKLI